MVPQKLRIAAVLLCAAVCSPAAHLTAPAAGAFDAYVASLERRLSDQHASPDTFLAILNAERRLSSGALRIEPVNGGAWEAGGALMHHWRAATFVPGVTAGAMLTLLRDLNHLSRYYTPQIVSSRALAGKGASLIRFKKQKVVSVVLDAEFQGANELIDNTRGYSISRSVHIWQVDEPGTAHERRRPEGDDDGFLWRLNSYWSFLQTRDGLLIECEAVSLTRNIPLGLGWLITPIIESLPRESLEFTLKQTKSALIAHTTKESPDDRTN
jgi:hypothetical protein